MTISRVLQRGKSVYNLNEVISVTVNPILCEDYVGLLMVNIVGTGSQVIDWDPKICGKSTVFEYVGGALARLACDMETRLTVAIRPEDIIVLSFSREMRTIEVVVTDAIFPCDARYEEILEQHGW